MVPLLLLFIAGYLALTPVPAAAEAGLTQAEVPWRERLRPAAVRGSIGAISVRTAAALGTDGRIHLVGAAPMAAASANRNADPIIAEAISGSAGVLDQPATPFQLTSQTSRSRWRACAARWCC